MRKKMFLFLCAGVIIFSMGCSNYRDNDDSGYNDKFETRIDSSIENTKEAEAFETDDPGVAETEKENAGANPEKEMKDLESNRLTLERVFELSEKDTLDWSDFDGYVCEEIGFGLVILKYDINRDFYVLVGGTGQGEPMYVRLVSAQNQEDYLELKKEEEIDSVSEGEVNLRQANGREDVERFIQEKRSVPYYFELTANIKEVGEDSLLIRSNSDSFPGVFSIIHVRDAMKGKETDELKEEFQELSLKGGMYIRILMESTNQTMQGKDKIPVYEAREITILSEDKVPASEDILLISAPALSLTDVLSSQYASFSVQSANYTWTTEENGEEREVIACGAAPLDEAGMQEKKKLVIPHYSTDDVLYGYSTKILPDILTVRQWDIADLGNHEAKEEKVVVYYDATNYLHLQRDKIYEFTAEWIKEKAQKNKFYGTASYTVVTE